MSDLLQTLGLDQKVAALIDKVQARVGEWLGIPAKLAMVAQRTQDPTILLRVSQLQADYRATQAVVQNGLAIAQNATTTRKLPPLDQVPILATAATTLLATTDTMRQLERAVGSVEPGTTSSGGGISPQVMLGGVAVVGVVAWLLVRGSRRRRSRRIRR